MKIDCYLSEHCGSYYQLRENIGHAMRELGLDAEVAEADGVLSGADPGYGLDITGRAWYYRNNGIPGISTG